MTNNYNRVYNFSAGPAVLPVEVLETASLGINEEKREEFFNKIIEVVQNFKDEMLVPLMSGAANVSLNIPKIQSIKIPVPSIDEQNQIIEKLEKNISTMIELENKLDECKRLQEKYNSEFKNIFI